MFGGYKFFHDLDLDTPPPKKKKKKKKIPYCLLLMPTGALHFPNCLFSKRGVIIMVLKS